MRATAMLGKKSIYQETHLLTHSTVTYVVVAAIILISIWYSLSAVSYARFVDRSIAKLSDIYSRQEMENVVTENETFLGDRQTFWGMQPSYMPNYLMSVFAVFGCLLIAVWSACHTGNEFNWKTAKVRAANDSWRSTILAKSALVIFLSILIVAFVNLIAVVSGHISWSFLLRRTEVAAMVGTAPPPANSRLIQGALLAAGFAFYGHVSMLATLLSRSSLVGGIAGIALPYLERIFPTWWSPNNAFHSLVGKNFTYYVIMNPPSSISYPTAFTSLGIWGILIGWCAISIAACILVSSFRNVY